MARPVFHGKPFLRKSFPSRRVAGIRAPMNAKETRYKKLLADTLTAAWPIVEEAFEDALGGGLWLGTIINPVRNRAALEWRQTDPILIYDAVLEAVAGSAPLPKNFCDDLRRGSAALGEFIKGRAFAHHCVLFDTWRPFNVYGAGIRESTPRLGVPLNVDLDEGYRQRLLTVDVLFYAPQ